MQITDTQIAASIVHILLDNLVEASRRFPGMNIVLLKAHTTTVAV